MLGAATTPPAGRPTTPQAERKKRQEREKLREMQRQGPMTISFFDAPPGGSQPLPPQAFIQSIQEHDARQKDRQEKRGMNRSGGAESTPTLHAPPLRERAGSAHQTQPQGRSRSSG